MEISQKQISLFTEEKSQSLPGDFHVKTQALQNKTVKVKRGCKVAEQVCFTKWSEPLTKSDQNMLLPKMSQIFLKLTEGQTLEQHSPNLPDWGTMQNGEFAVRQKSVHPITVPGCIWLLTPVASDCNRPSLSFPFYTRRHHRSAGSLTEHLYRLVGPVIGKVNPQFYAWMMGYPLNWLDNNYTDTATQ